MVQEFAPKIVTEEEKLKELKSLGEALDFYVPSENYSEAINSVALNEESFNKIMGFHNSYSRQPTSLVKDILNYKNKVYENKSLN